MKELLENITGVKQFTIEHSPTWAECTVEIDFDLEFDWGGKKVKAAHIIKECVEFWGSWERDLAEAKGDYLQLFLINLCRSVLTTQFTGDWNKEGVIEQYESKEGWMKLDGSMGVKLMFVEGITIEDKEEYTVKQVFFPKDR